MDALSPYSCHGVDGGVLGPRFEVLRAGADLVSGGAFTAMGSSSAGSAVSSAVAVSGNSAGDITGRWSGKTQSTIGLFTAAAAMRVSPRRHSVRASITAKEPPR